MKADKLRRLVPDAIRGHYLRKFATVVLLVVVVTAGFGYVFQQQVSAELKHEKHTEMETVAAVEAEQLGQWVEEHRQVTRMLSEMDDVRASDEATVRSQLSHEMDALPETTHGIHVVDLDSGTIEQSTVDSLDGTPVSDLDLRWASGSLEFSDVSETAVSEGFRYQGQELIAFASPVEGTSSAVLVTVDARERAEHFRDPIAGGYTQVVDSHGRVEFARNSSALLTQYRDGADSPVVQAGLSGETGATERSETGEVVAYAPVEGTDWVLVAHAPQSNAYVLRSAVTRDFLVLVGVALLGFVVVGLTIGRNTVGALTELRDSAQSLAAGETDVDVTDDGRIDEVGQARDAFRETVAYLNTIARQADALADQDFDAAVLAEDVPGDIGAALQTMQEDVEEFIVELEQSQAEARRSRDRAEDLAESLEEQAERVSEVVARAADGDLTARLDADQDHEAMARIATEFNELLATLEDAMVEIQDVGAAVATTSEEVAAGAGEIQQASSEVARSVDPTASGAKRSIETDD